MACSSQSCRLSRVGRPEIGSMTVVRSTGGGGGAPVAARLSRPSMRPRPPSGSAGCSVTVAGGAGGGDGGGGGPGGVLIGDSWIVPKRFFLGVIGRSGTQPEKSVATGPQT